MLRSASALTLSPGLPHLGTARGGPGRPSPATPAAKPPVVEPGHKLLFALQNHVPVYILNKGNVSGLYGNKTCLKIWNSAAAGLFLWYLYFHMLNDLYIC